MRNKWMLILLAVMLMLPSMAAAAGNEGEAKLSAAVQTKAGITPGDLFYFADRWIEQVWLWTSLAAQAKAEIWANISEERWAEMKVLEAEEKVDVAAEVKADYESSVEYAVQYMKEAFAEADAKVTVSLGTQGAASSAAGASASSDTKADAQAEAQAKAGAGIGTIVSIGENAVSSVLAGAGANAESSTNAETGAQASVTTNLSAKLQALQQKVVQVQLLGSGKVE